MSAGTDSVQPSGQTPSKALPGQAGTVWAKQTTSDKWLHSLKAESPTPVKASGRVMEVRCRQPQKAPKPMRDT